MLAGIRIERFGSNPLIDSATCPAAGDNINGPSVMRAPAWIKNPLGRYYMYFAHHSGTHIRLATADQVEGPWTCRPEKTLALADATSFKGHIASPDIHVLEDQRQIRMYFHGPVAAGDGQKTSIAHSEDGISFCASKAVLGSFYFRVWEWRGRFYALAKNGNSGWCEICRSHDGTSAFTDRRNFLRRARHVAVLPRGDMLLIFFTRVGDAPERILACSVDMRDDWLQWRPSKPVDVLRPNSAYEGAERSLRRSRHGPATGVRQLRDPCVFQDGEDLYLFYAVAGESGIAGARLILEPPTDSQR